MDKIGKYTIIEPIDKGGMGVVYKALDPRIGRVVAIKTILTHGNAEPELRRRFLQEARSAGALSHKNIITIYEMDEDQGVAFIAMEYLEGEDLRKIISRKGPVSLEEKQRILIEVCEGLAHAHEMGVIHRDIKPANIFITRTGQVKILDFGLARVASSDQTLTSGVMGTPSYMSPEQVRGEQLDHRSDIFSFGVMAYELITYIKPFQGDSDFVILSKITQSAPEPIDKVNPLVPAELAGVIAATLEKEPGKRYQQSADVLRELETVREILEERKRALREEVRTELSKLEGLVQANRTVLDDMVEKLTALKDAAPEFFEATIPAQTGDHAAKRRSLQLDFMTMVQIRDRARRENDRIPALLEKRQRAKNLLLEVTDLRESGQLESALELLDYLLREDPTYSPAVALKENISAGLGAQLRAQQVAELFSEAQSRFSSGELTRCGKCLNEVLQLQSDHAGALALKDTVREKAIERKRIEDQQRRADNRLVEAKQALATGNFQRARNELEQALQEAPGIAGAEELRTQIEGAEREAHARAARDLMIGDLLAEARALARIGKDKEALTRLSEIQTLAPQHAEASKLRASIQARRLKQEQAKDLFVQASTAFSKNDLTDSQALLKQAIELDPAQAEARRLLEQVNGRLAEQELIEKRRRQGLEALTRARTHLAAARLGEARRELDSALAAFPDISGAAAVAKAVDEAAEKEQQKKEREQRIQGLLDQANSRKQSGADDEALALAMQVLEMEPGHRRAADIKSEIEEIRRNAVLAAQKHRDRIASIMRRAHKAAAQGDLEKAIDLALGIQSEPEAAAEVKDLVSEWQDQLAERKEIEEQNRSKIERLLDSAQRLMAAKAFEEARKPLLAILDLRADHPEALDLLRRIQEQIKAEKARQATEEEGLEQKRIGLRLLSEKTFRESLPALRRAAELLEDVSGLSLSILEAEAGIRAEDVRAQVRTLLIEARRLFSAESFDSAHAALLTILKLAPDNAEARELLSRIELALEQQRTRSRTAEMLAKARQSLGGRDFQTAARLASEILLLDKGNPEAQDLLKKLEEAQQERARRGEIATLLAQCSQALSNDDFQRAAIHAREALLIDPQNADAQRLLKRIDDAQEARRKRDRVSTLLLQGQQSRARGELDSALIQIRDVLNIDPAHKAAKSLVKDLEKEIRQRDREQKRMAAEQERTRVANADKEEITILLKPKSAAALGLVAWVRRRWWVGIACALIIGAGIYAVIMLQGGAAELYIVTDPEGVSIRLDNNSVGTTSSGPLELRNLHPGPTDVRAEKEGFIPFRQRLTLAKGRNPILQLKLMPLAAQVSIRISEADVSVQIDGKEIGRSAAAGNTHLYSVNSGQRTIALFKGGFENYKKEVSLAPGQIFAIDAKLEKMIVPSGLAVLQIISQTSGAIVSLNGKDVTTISNGSATLKDLPPGQARVAVKRPGYVDLELPVTLVAGTAISKEMSLIPKDAKLILTTVPPTPGAAVYIDGVQKGTTDPAGILKLNNVSPENHALKVTKQGFRDWGPQDIKFPPGEEVKVPLPLVSAAPSMAALTVKSLPSGAEIWIDDKSKGITPLINLPIEAGNHRIKLRKEGYRETPERTVELKAGEPREEPSFALEPLRGYLEFDVQPEGTIATIDGQPHTTAKQLRIPLNPKTYDVELSFPGYRTEKRPIEIQDGKTIPLPVVLEVEQVPDPFLSLDKWEHPPDWVAESLMMRAVGRGTGTLKERLIDDFQLHFAIKIDKGVKASWVVRWLDSRNNCQLEVYRDQNTKTPKTGAIVLFVNRNGQKTKAQESTLPFPFDDQIEILMTISGNQIAIKGSAIYKSTTKGLQQISNWPMPTGSPARGSVGFVISEDEQFRVGNFMIEPIPRK